MMELCHQENKRYILKILLKSTKAGQLPRLMANFPEKAEESSRCCGQSALTAKIQDRVNYDLYRKDFPRPHRLANIFQGLRGIDTLTNMYKRDRESDRVYKPQTDQL